MIVKIGNGKSASKWQPLFGRALERKTHGVYVNTKEVEIHPWDIIRRSQKKVLSWRLVGFEPTPSLLEAEHSATELQPLVQLNNIFVL